MTISQLTAVVNELITLCLLSMNQSDCYYPCSQQQYQCSNSHCRVTNTDQLMTTSQCDLFYTSSNGQISHSTSSIIFLPRQSIVLCGNYTSDYKHQLCHTVVRLGRSFESLIVCQVTFTSVLSPLSMQSMLNQKLQKLYHFMYPGLL